MFGAARSLALMSIVVTALGCDFANAQTQTADAMSEKCAELRHVDFSRVPDAVTQILDTRWTAASNNVVAYCEVSGYVAPSFEFLVRLPAENWNGKFIEIGCGGPCGSTAHIARCADPLRRGYACIVSDGGHKAMLDVKWAYNNPHAPLDYFVLASHVTAVAGKAVLGRYYDRPPSKSYFMGCSAGGMQAMFAAQRFPWDFDGIVAGGPALHLTGVWMNWLWGNRALHDASGKALLEEADIELLHEAVVSKCDLNDGIKDGLIGDPRSCRFEPTELRCAGGKTSQCLTARQIEAIKNIYGGPATSKGEKIVMPAAMKGSERTWLDWFGGTAASPTPTYNYVGDWFRYANFWPNPGPLWKPEDFVFDHDYKRLGMAEGWDPVQNPDLRRFNAVGGKLLMYTGWSDSAEGVLRTVDYYETAERIVGGRAATQNFLRLFVIPGMNHCRGGEGPFAVDYLSYLEAWVEKGEAPDRVIGSHIKLDNSIAGQNFPLDPGDIEFSRPVYPYPMITKYRGSGDPNDPVNFKPVASSSAR